MVPQDATRAPLGHPWPSLSCHGQRRHVEDGRNPPPSAKLAHLVGRRHRAALRCLGLPGHARAEAAGGGGGEGRRVLPGLECLAQVSPHRSSPAHLAHCTGAKGAVLPVGRSGGASRARARRRLPVAACAGTGATVADATFLIGISSHRSIGAAADLGCTWRVRRAAARLARWPMRPSRPARM